MSSSNDDIPTAAWDLLDMWRERQPGNPSRREALERLELPKKAI